MAYRVFVNAALVETRLLLQKKSLYVPGERLLLQNHIFK